ncbi:hypothetical protein GCM10009839_14500 [Catenulispora yoronensis]|uniref:Uncharacterized protein n=1 Tax=Catenulispora yoronensis TaxID=450799 RepID=A0ABP5F8T5_9ACTN
MTESTAGDVTPEQDRERIAEMLRRNASAAGADLTQEAEHAGFLGAMAAVLAYAATGLQGDDQRAHAEALVAMIEAVAGSEPAFNRGWDAALTVHMSMVDNAVANGSISEEARNYLFDASAVLLRNG